MKWEYKTASIKENHTGTIITFLNSYGDDGWELINFQVAPTEDPVILFIFKRKK